jgi:hypothetical protein
MKNNKIKKIYFNNIIELCNTLCDKFNVNTYKLFKYFGLDAIRIDNKLITIEYDYKIKKYYIMEV